MSSAPLQVLDTRKPSYRGLLIPVALIGLAALLFCTLDKTVLEPAFTMWHFLALAAILFLAGMMSGMTGFAFSAIGALTLFLLAPITVVPLLQALSACNQMLSVRETR
jgi:hypothetical protein